MPVINFYHRWAYVDEICATLNQDLAAISAETNLPIPVIKIIRTLDLLDNISWAIFNSFWHTNHPTQVDNFKKLQWSQSLRKVLFTWHDIFHRLLQDSLGKHLSGIEFKGKITTTCDQEKKLLTQLIKRWNKEHYHTLPQNVIEKILLPKSFVTAITQDDALDPIKQKYAYIEPFFRGIHQMTEVAMNVMVDLMQALHRDIKRLMVIDGAEPKLDSREYTNILQLRRRMALYQHWWVIAAEHILLLNHMDSGSYAEYRQALLGSSGGDSKQLRFLKSLITTLHLMLPEALRDNKVITQALMKENPDPLLNQLLSAIRELQAASCDFWLRHFTLTANTIGIIRGTQGLPVEKLISFALSPVLKKDSLLQLVGKVGSAYAQQPQAMLVRVDNEEKIIGDTLLAHVKNEVTILGDYRIPLASKEGVLDAFELKPLTPNDSHLSPYIDWFDPDLQANGLWFYTHGFGTPLQFFNEAISKTANRLLESQNHYWETFFDTRIEQFRQILFQTLSIDNDQTFSVAVDANITTLLDRLLSALPAQGNTVLTTDQEFLTVNRTLAGAVHAKKFALEKIKIDVDAIDLAPLFIEAISKVGKNLKLLIFSQVMANSQLSLSTMEMMQIINHVPNDVPIIIDAAQGLFNTPISWGELLKNRNNVYVLGSCIKHGRSTSGLGFLIYPHNGVLQHPSQSGWCAYLSGLSQGRTTDDEGHLLYDEAWQWFGGTPSNVFSLELFINTWDAIRRAGCTIRTMHKYVQSLQQHFLQFLTPYNISVLDNKRREHYPSYASNAFMLVIPDKSCEVIVAAAAKKQIYFDHRQGLIRIGMGIEHSRQDMQTLLSTLI